jgi:hypothetical protein
MSHLPGLIVLWQSHRYPPAANPASATSPKPILIPLNPASTDAKPIEGGGTRPNAGVIHLQGPHGHLRKSLKEEEHARMRARFISKAHTAAFVNPP